MEKQGEEKKRTEEAREERKHEKTREREVKQNDIRKQTKKKEEPGAKQDKKKESEIVTRKSKLKEMQKRKGNIKAKTTAIDTPTKDRSLYQKIKLPSFKKFFLEKLELTNDKQYVVVKEELRIKFKMFCLDHRVPEMDESPLGKVMVELGAMSSERQIQFHGYRLYMLTYTGVRWIKGPTNPDYSFLTHKTSEVRMKLYLASGIDALIDKVKIEKLPTGANKLDQDALKDENKDEKRPTDAKKLVNALKDSDEDKKLPTDTRTHRIALRDNAKNEKVSEDASKHSLAHPQPATFKVFFSSHLQVTGNPDDEVDMEELRQKYCEFCDEHDAVPTTTELTGCFLNNLGLRCIISVELGRRRFVYKRVKWLTGNSNLKPRLREELLDSQTCSLPTVSENNLNAEKWREKEEEKEDELKEQNNGEMKDQEEEKRDGKKEMAKQITPAPTTHSKSFATTNETSEATFQVNLISDSTSIKKKVEIFKQFLAEKIEVTGKELNFIVKNELFPKYQQYCKDMNTCPLSLDTVNRKMRKISITGTESFICPREKARKYVFTGLAWAKGEANPDYDTPTHAKLGPSAKTQSAVPKMTDSTPFTKPFPPAAKLLQGEDTSGPEMNLEEHRKEEAEDRTTDEKRGVNGERSDPQEGSQTTMDTGGTKPSKKAFISAKLVPRQDGLAPALDVKWYSKEEIKAILEQEEEPFPDVVLMITFG